jgi:Family of unknown function (DUF6200)
MASTGSSAAGTAGTAPQHEKASGAQIVIVDLGGSAKPPRLVKELRNGKGKLMTKVERIVADLTQAGTIKSNAQPVVIVVREAPPSPADFIRSFVEGGSDDDDDD